MVSFPDLFRLSFMPQTGRSSYVIDDFFVKEYMDADECSYEYAVLREIATANPSTFIVPKVFKISINPRRSHIIMERMYGSPLQNSIIDFLLSRKNEPLKTFRDLGRALRELHHISLKNLHESLFPNSLQEIKLEISNLSEKLEKLHALNHKFRDRILNTTEKITHVNNKIFTTVNLHGEFYFTHIALSNGKYVFFDFHRACKGPSYFDLAMLNTSLYASITLPYLNPKQLTPLIDAFLTGYYKKDLDNETIKSIKLAELYITLREILAHARTLHIRNPRTIKLVTTLKMRRLKTAIKKIILPKLGNS